jgi:hypothetical protein
MEIAFLDRYRPGHRDVGVNGCERAFKDFPEMIPLKRLHDSAT